MVLSEGTTEKIPSDTTGDRSRDRPTDVCKEQKIYKLFLLFLYWEVQIAAKGKNAIDKKLQFILGFKFDISWKKDEARLGANYK